MTTSSNTHVVLGAGPLGRATAAALSAQGHAVRLANRSGRVPDLPEGVTAVAADLSDRAAARAAAAGAAAVYFCAQPPYHRWQREFPALQDAVIGAAAQSGARLIVAENLYGYGLVTGPMTEETPVRPNSHKGRVRAAMHETLMRAHAAGTVDVAVARGSDFFGPRVEGSAVGARFFNAVLAGKPVEVYGDPEAPHSYTYVGDFGRAMAILGLDARSSGQVWHVPNAPAVSTAEFLNTAARLAGTSAKQRPVSALQLRVVGLFIPGARETIEMLYEFEAPFVVDHGKFAAMFGDIATPLEAALAATLTTRATAPT